jgi:NADH dehydrogenase
VRTNALVAEATDKLVRTQDGCEIETASMIWTAGVKPAELATEVPAPHTRADRITVDAQLRVPGVKGAFAIGDAASIPDKHGRELPMTSPPAMQEGRYVAKQILGRGNGRPFRYIDKGTLATIGRTSAVGEVGPLRFTGFLGWLVWLVVHLYYLIGFENRLIVMLRWSWYYVRYDRPVRAIIRAHPPRTEP